MNRRNVLMLVLRYKGISDVTSDVPFLRLSCFPAYVTMIFEKSMDEYGVPPQRVAPLWGKGW